MIIRLINLKKKFHGLKTRFFEIRNSNLTCMIIYTKYPNNLWNKKKDLFVICVLSSISSVLNHVFSQISIIVIDFVLLTYDNNNNKILLYIFTKENFLA